MRRWPDKAGKTYIDWIREILCLMYDLKEVSLWDAAVAQKRKTKRRRSVMIKSALMSRCFLVIRDYFF